MTENIAEVRFRKWLHNKAITEVVRGVLPNFIDADASSYDVTVNDSLSPCTDGKQIWISLIHDCLDDKYTVDDWLIFLRAITAHECQHINSSRFEDLQTISEWYGKYLSKETGLPEGFGQTLGHQLLNTVEDGRIESIAAKRRPGMTKPFAYLNEIVRAGTTIEEESTDPSKELQDFLGNILSYAKTGLNAPGFDEFASTEAKSVFDAVKADIDAGVNSVTSEECRKHVEALLTTCTPYFAQLLPKASERPQQPPQPKPEYTNNSEKQKNDSSPSPLRQQPQQSDPQGSGGGQQEQQSSSNNDQSGDSSGQSNGSSGEKQPESPSGQKGQQKGQKNQRDRQDQQDSSGNGKKDGSENNPQSQSQPQSGDESGRQQNSNGGSQDSGKENSQQDSSQPSSDTSSDQGSSTSSSADSQTPASSGRKPSTTDPSGNDPSGNSQTESQNNVQLTEDDIRELREAVEKLLKAAEIQIAQSEIKDDNLSPKEISLLCQSYGKSADSFVEETLKFPPVSVPQDIKFQANDLRRALIRILKNKRRSYKGLRSGNLDVNAVWKTGVLETDVFQKKRRTDAGETVFYLLIDNSGSMNAIGNNTAKYFEARIAASIVEEALHGLAPCKIALFHSTNNQTKHVVIKPFEAENRSGSITLASLKHKPCGYNADSVHIRLSAAELLKRREARKVLIVLSDGLPSAYASRANAVHEVQKAVNDVRRQGIVVIPIMFGADDFLSSERVQFQEMYGNNVLACQPGAIAHQLSELFKKLLSIG